MKSKIDGRKLAELIKKEKEKRRANKMQALTQKEIAEFCGVGNYQTIQYWIKYGVPIDYSTKLASFFGISEEQLLLDENEQTSPNYSNSVEAHGSFHHSPITLINSSSPLMQFRNSSLGQEAPPPNGETPASAASNEEEDVLPGEVELTVNSVAHMGNGLIAISAQGARGEVFPANVDIGFGGIKMLDSILSSFRNQTVIRLGGAVKMQNGLIERANFTRLG